MAIPPLDVKDFLPLNPPLFHILLALGGGTLHGYAVMGEIERRTGGAVRLLPGTLYSSIRRMVEDGLIEESGERPAAEEDDSRRRYYRATGLGLAVARAEARRMATLLQVAADQDLVAEPVTS